jgi:hypothetical protein
MEKPKSHESYESFEKTENVESISQENSQEKDKNDFKKDQITDEINEKLVNNMISEGKFNTFQAARLSNPKEENEEADSQEYKTESLQHHIDDLGNLDPTESEKKIQISDKYDIELVGKQTKNSRYDNFDSNIPDSEDNEELQDQVTDLNDVTRFGNKSIFENVRFTDSVNMRVDDYKRTSNYQKLIEEELLKDKISIPEMPESVINPKKKEEKEQENEQEKENKEDENEELEDMDMDLEEQMKKRHLTMIKKARDTELTLDNNLTIMELANDIGSERGTNKFDSETGPEENNLLFKNEYIPEQVENEKSLEEIGKKEEEIVQEQELVNVTNLQKDDQETEKQTMFKKELKEPEKYEQISESNEIQEQNNIVEQEVKEEEKSKLN